jgi:hypothetical protein
LAESEEEASEEEQSDKVEDPDSAKFDIFSNDEGGDASDSDAIDEDSDSS